MAAQLVEIFSSIQGEGPYLGVRQIFIRFAGCNLKCAYCDTFREFLPTYRVLHSPGPGTFAYYPNPAEPQDVVKIIEGYNLDSIHSISLTGGEPLLYTGFIKDMAARLRDKNVKYYLETNGTLPNRLQEILPLTDIISMDFKLPSATKGQEMWEAHREFLKVGCQKDIFAKVVVAGNTTDQEIINTCQIIRAVNPDIPLILQPVTNDSGIFIESVPVSKLMFWQELAFSYVNDIRVIPQTHKFMGQL